MKSVLISIQPKWCELIASGKKTVEVRKTKPKLQTPFKCYIYCTKAKEYFSLGGGLYACSDELYRLPTGEIKFGDSFELAGNWSGQYGKDNFYNGKVIGEFVCDDIGEFKVFENGSVQYWNYHELGKTCLTYDELANYIGKNKDGYGWHISDLVIYAKPKELNAFGLKRPPQSWGYVDELAKG